MWVWPSSCMAVWNILACCSQEKQAFPNFGTQNFTLKQKLFTPALIGIAVGVFIIAFELVFGRFHDLGPLPHPPFPSSILATMGAAIGEEILFRLFFIPFFIWLISPIILKNKWQTQIFWIVTFFSAIVFSLIHIPTVMIVYGLESINQIPDALLIGILVVNSVVSFFAAWYFKKVWIHDRCWYSLLDKYRMACNLGRCLRFGFAAVG
jgi:membrane protease YdiL (CAAX protease family)